MSLPDPQIYFDTLDPMALLIRLNMADLCFVVGKGQQGPHNCGLCGPAGPQEASYLHAILVLIGLGECEGFGFGLGSSHYRLPYQPAMAFVKDQVSSTSPFTLPKGIVTPPFALMLMLPSLPASTCVLASLDALVM